MGFAPDDEDDLRAGTWIDIPWLISRELPYNYRLENQPCADKRSLELRLTYRGRLVSSLTLDGYEIETLSGRRPQGNLADGDATRAAVRSWLNLCLLNHDPWAASFWVADT